MKSFAKWGAALAAALICALLVLPGLAAGDTAQSAPSLPQPTAAAEPTPAPARPTVRMQTNTQLKAELLSLKTPAVSADEPEEEPAQPVYNPVVAQYAASSVTSSRAETYIPDAIAAFTADVAVPDDLQLIDSFLATAYCLTGTTSTGTQTTVGRTLAVNPGIIAYGTEVWMFLDDGTYVGTFTAEDTGSNMLAHPHVVDIYMGADSYDDCILWGAQHVWLYTRPAET